MKKIFLCITMLALSHGATAEDFVKNGNPCLSGVCLGDDLTTLSSIAWERAVIELGSGRPIASVKFKPEEIKMIAKKLVPQSESDLVAAAPYLKFYQFDKEGIAKLAKIKGFCEGFPFFGLTGTFKSESGHRTRVTADVEPSTDGSAQAIRVTMISRTYPPEYTEGQWKELNGQLKERYASVLESLMPSTTQPTWSFSQSERRLRLWGPVGNSAQKRDLLRQFPGCGKTLKVD